MDSIRSGLNLQKEWLVIDFILMVIKHKKNIKSPCYCISCINILGQSCVLQSLVSKAVPLQGVPPSCAYCLTFLVLDDTPPPQDSLHCSHSCHVFHSQSTIKINSVIFHVELGFIERIQISFTHTQWRYIFTWARLGIAYLLFFSIALA